MVQPLFDHDHVPTDAAFEAAVGATAELWERLTRRVSIDMGARPLISWGGSKNGWEIRYRRAGRSFLSLSPGEDSFRACVVLGAREAAAAGAEPLSASAHAILGAAHQFPDGTWLFITIRTADDLETVLRFLELKLPNRVRRAMVGPPGASDLRGPGGRAPDRPRRGARG
jgi:hypothetical protein